MGNSASALEHYMNHLSDLVNKNPVDLDEPIRTVREAWEEVDRQLADLTDMVVQARGMRRTRPAVGRSRNPPV